MLKSHINTVVNRLRRFSQENSFAFPIALLILAIITYGILIFSLGFFWDDWPPLLLSHLADKTKIWEYFIYDRPFQSWTYYYLFPVCRDSAFCWQLSAILFRWAASLFLYFTFLRIFPRQKVVLQWSAILFIVFPGFSNQFSSVSFSSHFVAYTVFAASLLTMVLAIQNKKRFWLFYPISLVLTGIHLFTMEYFVGLEVLRVWTAFFLIYLGDKTKRALRSFLFFYLPYIGLLIYYIYWRVVRYPIMIVGLPDSNYPYLIKQFFNTPLTTLVGLIKTIFADLKFLLITSWVDRLFPDNILINSATFWLSILIGVLAVIGFFFLFYQKKAIKEFVSDLKETKILIIFALVIVFFGLMPIWISARQITVGKWSDRFSIAVIFGVTLFITTLIFVVFNNWKIKSSLLIILTVFSISYHIQNGNEYRKDFNRQKAFYTQLSWRIPQLKPGTTLYSPGIPTSKEADYSISMGINMLFSSQVNESLDYWFLVPRYVSPQSLVEDPTQTIIQGLRIFAFKGSGEKVVSIHMPDTGCLWVINQYYALTSPEILPFYAEFSNEEQIVAQEKREPVLMEPLINLAPQNTWCYFFEKSDLAQSKGEWSKAIEYYRVATQANLHPLEGIEFLPVIQSYVKLGKIDEAIEVTQKAITLSPLTTPVYCKFWGDAVKIIPEIKTDTIVSFYNSEFCPLELQ